MVTTGNGFLNVTLDRTPWRGLDYKGGLIMSWNKFCFTGGYFVGELQMSFDMNGSLTYMQPMYLCLERAPSTGCGQPCGRWVTLVAQALVPRSMECGPIHMLVASYVSLLAPLTWT